MTVPADLAELLERVRQSADPDARELAARVARAIHEPERRVGAAFGLWGSRTRARDDALRALAEERRRPGQSLAALAREVRREVIKWGTAAPVARHVQRIIE